MRIKYIIIIMLMLTYFELDAQSLKIVRTDVDSSRSNFVTATFLFGFDIYLEDVENCRGISFRMDYDQIDFVHFSEYAMDDFGEKPLAVVHNKLDNLAKKGSLYIGIGTNDSVDAEGIDNPKVIHLEFGVSQSVAHDEELTIDFENIYAVVASDTGRSIINIQKEPIIYNIHSFVDVWPGDSDDNGEVDENDFIPINFYMGYGSATKNMRSFKRRSASTIWAPHKVLAWDVIDATYADCDGNGDVTTTDLLVVNMHLPEKIEKENDSPLSELFIEPVYSKPGTHSIPIYVDKSEPYTGVAGKISWDKFPENVKVLGLERGDIFEGDGSFFLSYVNEEEKSAQLAFINTSKNDFNDQEGVLAYLIVENGHPDLKVSVKQLMGSSPFGYLFPISSVTNVNEGSNDQECVQFNQNSENINIISNCDKINTVTIYDLMGKTESHTNASQINPYELFISTDDLGNGFYLAIIQLESKSFTIPFPVIR
jgi:hypothetical protein